MESEAWKPSRHAFVFSNDLHMLHYWPVEETQPMRHVPYRGWWMGQWILSSLCICILMSSELLSSQNEVSLTNGKCVYQSQSQLGLTWAQVKGEASRYFWLAVTNCAVPLLGTTVFDRIHYRGRLLVTQPVFSLQNKLRAHRPVYR